MTNNIGSKAVVKKIVLIGDGAVGKTTLRKAFMGEKAQGRYMPTIGADISVKEVVISEKIVRFIIWDLAGQERFNTVRPIYYQGTQGAIFVYDITRPKSLANLKNWLAELNKHSGRSNLPLIIVGNKVDLRNTVSSSLSTEQGLEFFKGIKQTMTDAISSFFLETCALTGQNVDETFDQLGRFMIKKS